LIKENTNMNRKVLIVIAVVAIAAVGIYFSFPTLQRLVAPMDDKEADLEYLDVERGTLSSAVSATGSVEPRAETALSFETSGRIVELLVQENDSVEKGDVLAGLDTARLAESVLQTKAALAGAEAQVAKVLAGPRTAEVASAKAAVSAAEAGLAAAQADLDRAKAQLDQVAAGPTEADVAIAQSAVDSAQAQLDQLLVGPDEQSVEIARLSWDLARNALWQAQLERDAVKGRRGVPAYQKDLTDAVVGAAEISTVIAQLQHELAGKGATDEAIRVAQEGVRQAQAQLDKVKAGASQAEIDMARAGVDAAKAQVAVAQAQVDQAKAQLELLQSGPSEEDVALAQAQVDQAKATLRQAELALDGAMIVAPLDGVVAMLHADLNELIAPNAPVISLIDAEEFHIDVSVDEADVGKIAVGQDVEITLDAFRDKVIEGQVDYIAPTATMDAGIVSYLVRIIIGSTDLTLRSGLTANASIITEVHEDVLLVPNLAISIDPESGRKYVSRKTLTGIEEVEIETGLTTDLYSEVVSGLQDGDSVALSSLSSRERFREMMGSTFMGRGE
jgi:HlyD family secretion protein